MTSRHQSSNAGIALLTATLFLAMAVLVLGALSMRVVNQNKQVAQFVNFKDAYQGIETAFVQSKANLETGGTGMIGLGTWTPPTSATPQLVLPSFDSDGIMPFQISTMPNVEYMAFVDEWSNDNLDNNGDGTIDGIDEDFIYTIYTFARNQGVRRQAEVVVGGADVNVWRNAIFGGTGQAGGLINGNVSIHGSVHLLGDSLPLGAIAVCALDLSGTSLIHNNYGGLDPALAARIPPPPTTVHNGETVTTLNAKLRVKKGLVGLSGNSEIGEPNVVGNGTKESMDGAYVNDGWTGNAVNDDGDRGDPTSVYSDNGWDTLYDCGSRVSLPLFSDDWRDMYTGATTANPSTGANYTHYEYFHDVLAATPYQGNMTIACNANFYYNATRPSDPDPAHRQPTDDYILFNATTNRMEVNGQIEINGDLVITRGGGNDKTINYTGRAAILARGDVTLDTDLLSMNTDGTTANSFPVNNCLGIMAQNNMTVGSLSQLTLMGAFYAQNQLISSKQTTTLGTFVSNYFNMGTNVPDIYQVPTLANNLPYGMVGAYPILMYEQISWRETGI